MQSSTLPPQLWEERKTYSTVISTHNFTVTLPGTCKFQFSKPFNSRRLQAQCLGIRICSKVSQRIHACVRSSMNICLGIQPRSLTLYSVRLSWFHAIKAKISQPRVIYLKLLPGWSVEHEFFPFSVPLQHYNRILVLPGLLSLLVDGWLDVSLVREFLFQQFTPPGALWADGGRSGCGCYSWCFRWMESSLERNRLGTVVLRDIWERTKVAKAITNGN